MTAQSFAQVVQAQLCKLFWVCTVAWLSNCSTSLRSNSLPPPKSSSHQFDQIISSGSQVFLFDFNQSRYQKWPMTTLSAALENPLKNSNTLFQNWLAIPIPGHPFTPIKALAGPNGNFFLIDLSQKRICLYDTAGQIISTASLPVNIQARNLDQMEVYWTRDGLFSFLDLRAGRVWQYAELHSNKGSADWQLRNSFHLPLNLESCLWEPYLKNPCFQKANSSTNLNSNSNLNTHKYPEVTCLDNYFNPVGGLKESMMKEGYSVEAVSTDAKWKIRFHTRRENIPMSLFTLITNSAEAFLVPADSLNSPGIPNSNSIQNKP